MRRSGVERKLVLIVGSETDPHVAAVSSLCRQTGARCVALSGETFFTLRFGSGRGRRPRSDSNISVLGGEPISVWWRLKPSFFREKQVDPMTMFERREWTQTLESLERIFPSARWVNPRAAERSISHKPNQLKLAQQCGLSIPDTIVSNSPRTVHDFVSKQPNRKAIHKIFSWINGPAGETVYTNIVDLAFISRYANSIKNCPGIFQEVVTKAFELRIMIVGTEIFAVRIESQSRPDTAVDWRRNQFDVPYSAYDDLPRRLVGKLFEFHRRAGLRYGAYDFIVTPSGDFVFLEVNPAGQWLWLEDATRLPVAAAMAKLLTRGM